MKKPIIIPRAQHHLSRSMIDKSALKVLYHLHKSGYDAYLVGGCVRDLLLSKHPKDYDVVTNATPTEVKKLFSNCRLIGRRFRLAHIYFGRHIIEVATFRGPHEENPDSDLARQKDGIIVRDNIYGTIEEDAWRRDFSINALYYNIADFSITDYTGGLDDIEKKRVHIIGDAETRYREDPVRMLRAIRFAAKLDFKIAKETEKPLLKVIDWLEYIAPSRLFDEVIKLFHSGHAQGAYLLLKKYNVMDFLFPATSEALPYDNHHDFLMTAFADTDSRLAEEKHVSVAYLFAFLLWPALSSKIKHQEEEDIQDIQVLIDTCYQVISDQCCVTAIPKRITGAIHEIWRLQYRLEQCRPRTVQRALESSRFRAAFDLLKLRSHFDKKLIEAVNWWELKQEGQPV